MKDGMLSAGEAMHERNAAIMKEETACLHTPLKQDSGCGLIANKKPPHGLDGFVLKGKQLIVTIAKSCFTNN